MKMNSLLALLFFSYSGFATMHEDLVKMFHEARDVDFMEVQGVYSGRCFDLFNPNLARSSGLIILAGAKDYLVEASFDERFPGNRMDDKSQEYIASVLGKVSYLYSDATHFPLSSEIIEQETILRVRKSGETLVTKYDFIGKYPRTFRMRGAFEVMLRPGDTFGSCIYGRKIQNYQ